MRTTAVALFILSLGAGLFAWWGLYTAEGRQRFDEMDGLYPFFAGCGAAVILVISGVLFAVHYWRGRRG